MLGTGSINLDLPDQGFRSPTLESSPLAGVRSSRGFLPVQSAPVGGVGAE